MIEVLITAIKKGHIIITYCKLTSKGMKRFPFFNWPNHHTPIVQSSLTAALNVDSPTVAFSESFSKNQSCCIGRIILLHLLKKKQKPTFLKHQFGYQNCRCGTYHSMKAMFHGHLKILEIYAEICLQWWWGVHLKYSLQKKKKLKIKGIQFTFWWATHSVCIRYKSSIRMV